MKTLRSFARVINLQTLVVAVLASGATFACNRFEVYADIPTAIIGIAIIFPIVFSINTAYRRREEALRYLASLKGHIVAIYFGHRDWIKNDAEHAGRARGLAENLFTAIRDYFIAERASDREDFKAVYRALSELSRSHENLRAAGVTTSEISRINQYLRSVMVEFEKMCNIYLYRTPLALRAYSKVFLNVFPILFAPSFANLGHESFVVFSYVVAVVYSLVLVSLDNIQEDLENPYDRIGEDDINLELVDAYAPILR